MPFYQDDGATIPPMMPPQPEQDPIRSQPYTWEEVRRMVLEHKSSLIIANLVALAGTLVAVPVPLLMPILVDEVLLGKPGALVGAMNLMFPESWHDPITYITAILGLTLILRACTLVFSVWQMREFSLIAKDVIFRMRRDLLFRLQRFSMAEYEVLGASTVASHLVTDLDAVDQFVSSSTSKFVVALLTVTASALVLLWMHWQLALLILLLNPFVIALSTSFGRKVKKLKARENGAYQAFQESLAETLDAIHQIRASNRERHYILRVIDKADGIRTTSANYAWKSDAATRTSFMVFSAGFDLFRATAMFMVVYSDLSVGEMLAVFAYLWFMMNPVQELLSIHYAYHSATAALGRINSLVDVGLEPQFAHQRNPFAGKRTTSIQLQGICFAYGDGPPVLNDVSLDISPGEKVALVGASGGGKTTLVQILLGLYLPNRGQVCFDGAPVEQIGLDVVRDNVATVLQHPALLNDTVRMNLTLGRELSDAELWRALSIAQLQLDVERMPKGLDTLIGRDGIRLSGGQRQRLAVARMVLCDPKIVILDEATSALDTSTESHLHQALQQFLVGRTTLIIAHRLSAVKQADRVLVFEDGRIVEQGHHDALINQGGLYSKLYRQ